MAVQSLFLHSPQLITEIKPYNNCRDDESLFIDKVSCLTG